jgi:N-methylhydantoinase B
VAGAPHTQVAGTGMADGPGRRSSGQTPATGDGRKVEGPEGRDSGIDPITVSVIQHRLEAIVQEMGEAMLRTSYSQILNSSRDFSTAICDAEGRLVAQAEHVPIHVGAIPWAVRSVRQFFGDRVRPGDVYLLNDPYHGNNHLPDLTAFVPVFAPGVPGAGRTDGADRGSADTPPDRLVFWSINRSHQSDIGGATHGAYNPGATEIFQEGIRITPLRLYEAGVVRDDVLAMLATNVRHPRDFQGDLAAMIGSARVGERRLLALLAEYGPAVTAEAVEAILDGAERQTRACIATWRDGVYKGEAILDDDGHGIEDIYVRATVRKKGSDLVVDLSESHLQVIGFVNSSYPNMRSAVAMALAYLIEPDTPKNDGTFRPLTVVAKPGTVVWANPPAPLTLCTNHCAQEIAEAVIKALAPACPDRVLAGWGRRFRIAIQGKDPRTGRPFIWHMFHARPGGGASPAGDGWPTAGEGQAAGGIKFGSVEVTEVRFPLFFARHEFRPDSGGDGKHRGGVGAVLELHVETREPALANTAGDGVRYPPYGILRGQDGLPHRYRLRSRGRPDRVLKTKEVGILVRPGDVFVVESGGGGGYGDPGERTAEARAYDLENGFVTGSRVNGTDRRRPPATPGPEGRSGASRRPAPAGRAAAGRAAARRPGAARGKGR